MKQFTSIEKIDTTILYALELASSLSVLLLAFGLIASMANVLTKGSVLSDNILMQRIWAWTQCIAIDASVAGTIIRTSRFFKARSWLPFTLYALLSCLLLFTAAIVSNIESIQQTLNITLESAYTHVFVSVEVLIWVRSLVIVLLIVAHALRHVQTEPAQDRPATPPVLTITPELVNELRLLLTATNIIEEHAAPPQIPEESTTSEGQETLPVSLFPAVSEEERNKVIAAFTQGVPRREICSYLHWGSAKYSTIVKPALDAYEQQEQQEGKTEPLQ